MWVGGGGCGGFQAITLVTSDRLVRVSDNTKLYSSYENKILQTLSKKFQLAEHFAYVDNGVISWEKPPY